MPADAKRPAWVQTSADYVRLGLAVTPTHVAPGNQCSCGDLACPRPGAHPRVEDWLSDVVTEESELAAWDEVFGHSGVGLAVSPDVGGVCALIIDASGYATFNDLIAQGLQVTHTPSYTDGAFGLRVVLFEHPGAGHPDLVDVGRGVRLVLNKRVLRLPDAAARRRGDARAWEVTPSTAAPRPLPRALRRLLGNEQHTPRRAVPATLPFVSAATLSSETHDLANRILFPWINGGTVTVVVGMPKASGKTRLLCAIAGKVAAGGHFLGRMTVATPVAYLTEQPRASFANSMDEAYVDDQAARERIHVLSTADLGHTHWAALSEDIGAYCSAIGARLLIIDSLDAFAPLEDVGPAARAASLARLAALGLAVVVSLPLQATEPGIQGALEPLGPLASLANTIIGIAPADVPNAPKMRRLDVLSRDAEASGTLTIEWDGSAYVERETLPLFDAPARPLRRVDVGRLGSALGGAKSEAITQAPAEA